MPGSYIGTKFSFFSIEGGPYMGGNTVYYNRAVIISGPIFTFCPFYGVLCKRGPSNLQNDDYAGP